MAVSTSRVGRAYGKPRGTSRAAGVGGQRHGITRAGRGPAKEPTCVRSGGRRLDRREPGGPTGGRPVGRGPGGRVGQGEESGGADGRELAYRIGRGPVGRMPNVGRAGGRIRTGGDRDGGASGYKRAGGGTIEGRTDGCRTVESGGWGLGGDRSAGAKGVKCTAARM